MRFQVLFVALLALSGAFAQNNTVQEVVEIFQGFVNGLGQEIDVSQVASCINDAESIIGDFEKAVGDFEQNNAGAAWNGIQSLVSALEELPAALTSCKAAEAEIEAIAKAIEAFGSPVSFFYDITKHIFVNHKEITGDVISSINAYKSQDWQDFGFYVGETVGIVVFGNPSISAVTPQVLPSIFEGILVGIGAETAYTQIQSCIDLGSAVAENITEASADFTTGNYQHILQGIILLAETLQVLPQAIQQCQGAEQDVEKLIQALEAYQNPTSFIYNAGKNLLINGVNIYHELSNASLNYQSGNWYYYGYDVGLALATIVWGNNASISLGNDAQNVLDFSYGVLVGVAAAENWSEIQSCIDSSETVLQLLEQAYGNFTQETPEAVLQGIITLGEAAQIIPNAIQECHVSVAELEEIVKAIEAFQSPVSFAYHVGVSLLLNGFEIYHEVTGAVNQYKAQNWTGFGYYVGEAFATLIIGDDGVLSSDFVDFLNQRVGWTAGIPPQFANMTFAEMTNTLLGVNLDLSDYNITTFDYNNLVQDIPVSFDARQQWPNCIHPIRDQGQCGSCWAFGATETLSDRLCIASNGSVNQVLSPQYLVSCDDLNFGCNGGNLYLSWMFMADTGVVTDACDPYQSSNGTSPKCSDFTQCADGSNMTHYYAAKGTIAMLDNPTSIQSDLLQYGPVDTGMEVYQDFMSYTGGIYVHTSGKLLGGHAIKIVGWGQENTTNYWIVANSWGTSWGEDGFFRIEFGQCGIDSDAVSGQADPSRTGSFF